MDDSGANQTDARTRTQVENSLRQQACFHARPLYLSAMNLSLVQTQAIAAKMALLVGAKEFDRLFLGVEFSEVDGDILFMFAHDEELADELQDKYALHISIIATDILKRDIGIVVVLPRVLH